MKQLRSAVSVFIVLAATASACATSEDAPVAAEPVNDAATPPVNINPGKSDATAAAETSTTPPKVCVANCATDAECQTSCPAAPNSGLNCCDVNSGVCYATSGSTCGGVDGGTD